MFTRTAQIAAAFLIVTTLFPASRTEACISSSRPAIYFEFLKGSSDLSRDEKRKFGIEMRSLVTSGQYVDSYYILASGDLAEGEQWSKASLATREADRRLGKSRAKAVAALVSAQPRDIRSANIALYIRENRQIFTAEQTLADSRLNDRLRVGVSADVRIRIKKSRRKEPSPLC